MENKEAPVSFYVLAAFGLLFLVFFFLGQPETSEQQKTGNDIAITGALSVGSITSTAGLIVIGTVAILVIGFAFIFMKKMSNKKKRLGEAEVPQAPKVDKSLNLPGSKLEEKHKEAIKEEIPDRDVDDLFGEDLEPHIKASDKREEEEIYKPTKPLETQKSMVNVSELKNKIKEMLRERRSKEDIFRALQSEGYTPQQIETATDEINLETLKDYIGKCLSRGLGKSQIFENLKAKNWKMGLINKAFLSFS